MVDDVFGSGRRFYRPGKGKSLIPVEFQAAAYRFGHSMVRPSYRANLAGDKGRPFFAFIFDPPWQSSRSRRPTRWLPGTTAVHRLADVLPACSRRIRPRTSHTTRTGGRACPQQPGRFPDAPISSGLRASTRRAEVSEPFAVTPCRFLRHDPQSVARLTRADLLRRGVGGGVGLALLGGLPGAGCGCSRARPRRRRVTRPRVRHPSRSPPADDLRRRARARNSRRLPLPRPSSGPACAAA